MTADQDVTWGELVDASLSTPEERYRALLAEVAERRAAFVASLTPEQRAALDAGEDEDEDD